MSYALPQLAELGTHAQACAVRAQTIASTLILRGTCPPDLDQVARQIEDLERDYGALVAALRAELGRRTAEQLGVWDGPRRTALSDRVRRRALARR